MSQQPAPGGLAASAPILGRAAEPTVFELSSPGRSAWSFPSTDLPEWTAEELVPAVENALQGQKYVSALLGSVETTC